MESHADVLIATWNVNSIRRRIHHVVGWLRGIRPDVLCLQELKCVSEQFPGEPLEDEGYHVYTVGQKTFNGVAILSRFRGEVVSRALAGDPEDTQARFLEVLVTGDDRMPIRIASMYLPNGNPVDSPKYPYKLKWMDRLIAHARLRMRDDVPFVLAGDLNVIPNDLATHDPEKWWGDSLYRQETLDRYRELVGIGLTCAIGATHPGAGHYTFWDYTAGAYRRNKGIRIDHILASPSLADRLVTAGIDRDERGVDQPSDHVPLWARFDRFGSNPR